MAYGTMQLTFTIPTPRELGLRKVSDTIYSSESGGYMEARNVFQINVLPGGFARLRVSNPEPDGSVILDRTYFSFGVACLAMQMLMPTLPVPLVSPGLKRPHG